MKFIHREGNNSVDALIPARPCVRTCLPVPSNAYAARTLYDPAKLTHAGEKAETRLLFRGWSRLCLHTTSLNAAEGALAAATPVPRVSRCRGSGYQMVGISQIRSKYRCHCHVVHGCRKSILICWISNIGDDIDRKIRVNTYHRNACVHDDQHIARRSWRVQMHT